MKNITIDFLFKITFFLYNFKDSNKKKLLNEKALIKKKKFFLFKKRKYFSIHFFELL